MKKTISTLSFLTLIIGAKAQTKGYITFDAGTSTKLTPVASMYGGIEHRSENSNLKPFIEAGLRTHIDNRNIAYGSLNAGLEANLISFSTGIAYGGCKSEDDVYIKPDGTEEVLYNDVKGGFFISPVFTVKMKVAAINDNPIWLGVNYCQNVVFFNIGIKGILGE